MKKNHLILSLMPVLLFSLCALTACGPQEEPGEPTPLARAEVTAESWEDKLILRWPAVPFAAAYDLYLETQKILSDVSSPLTVDTSGLAPGKHSYYLVARAGEDYLASKTDSIQWIQFEEGTVMTFAQAAPGISGGSGLLVNQYEGKSHLLKLTCEEGKSVLLSLPNRIGESKIGSLSLTLRGTGALRAGGRDSPAGPASFTLSGEWQTLTLAAQNLFDPDVDFVSELGLAFSGELYLEKIGYRSLSVTSEIPDDVLAFFSAEDDLEWVDIREGGHSL